jgi:hypothetical protein
MRIFVAIMIAMTFMVSVGCQQVQPAKTFTPKYKTEFRYCFS